MVVRTAAWRVQTFVSSRQSKELRQASVAVPVCARELMAVFHVEAIFAGRTGEQYSHLCGKVDGRLHVLVASNSETVSQLAFVRLQSKSTIIAFAAGCFFDVD